MAKFWENGYLINGKSPCSHELYNTFISMHHRCSAQKHPSYAYYGARGIGVCERWFKFENFLTDMGEKPSSDVTIERVDNSLGYCAENCKWASKHDQQMNRRLPRNNTSGSVGVKKENRFWSARVKLNGCEYHIGSFLTKDEAVKARESLLSLYIAGGDAALSSINYRRTPRPGSKTSERNIYKNGKGFMVQITVLKARHHLGTFETIEEALHAKQRFLEQQTQRTQN
jgi:hypothetical protein